MFNKFFKQQAVAERYAVIPIGMLNPGLLQYNSEFDCIINTLLANPHDRYRLGPRQFEDLVAEMWARMGYNAALTPSTRDGGRDVIASKHTEVRTQVLIECKRYNRGQPVGVDVAQRLLGAVALYDATQGVIATTSMFTRDAIKVMMPNLTG